jgi:hypothetical protein
VILFHLNDRDARFRVTNNAFSGKIPLRESTYAYVRLPRRRIFLFLSPGEQLEMTVSRSAPPLFEGSLAAINDYLAEQGEYLPFNQGLFQQGEETFVKEINELLRVRTLLLEAKNLGHEFTRLERERLGYSAAEHAVRYAMLTRSRLPDSTRGDYQASNSLREFIARFPVDNEKLTNVSTFLRFALSYYSFEIERSGNIRGVTVDIIQHVKTRKIKEHLLSELVFRHIYTHGMQDGEYLLSLCRQEIKDSARITRVERAAERWRRLSAGTTAPDITLRAPDGINTRLQEMRGSYLYVVAGDARDSAWQPDPVALQSLKRRYAGKNIRFLHLVFDPSLTTIRRDEHAEKNEEWEHFLILNWREFHASYVISSLPRYFFIDPHGRFVTALASSPARSTRAY